jgi:hypothetical protein
MSATYSVVAVTHPFDNPYRILERSCFRRLYAGCILSLMASTATFHESRRSTRVPLKVVIAIAGGAESRTCEGETIIVNLHGALIATAIGLSGGMRISIRVYLTDKRAAARVVYIDPKNPLLCGIELAEPRKIWGVPCRPMTGMRQRPWRPSIRREDEPEINDDG